ncbi:hypothetical protein BGX33_007155 [Mortierella sp. NVP41]|nr:hypothetical protein BGX33_007155 [Mortierella sp. NVP41]
MLLQQDSIRKVLQDSRRTMTWFCLQRCCMFSPYPGDRDLRQGRGTRAAGLHCDPSKKIFLIDRELLRFGKCVEKLEEQERRIMEAEGDSGGQGPQGSVGRGDLVDQPTYTERRSVGYHGLSAVSEGNDVDAREYMRLTLPSSLSPTPSLPI